MYIYEATDYIKQLQGFIQLLRLIVCALCVRIRIRLCLPLKPIIDIEEYLIKNILRCQLCVSKSVTNFISCNLRIYF